MIRVGLTSTHGIIKEIIEFPPKGVTYFPIKPLENPILTHPSVKYFATNSCNLVETFDFPCFTNNNWIYQCCSSTTLASFTLFGDLYPKEIRLGIIKRLLLKDNFKKLVMQSRAGLKSIKTFAGWTGKSILDKTVVVYPAIRKVDDKLIQFNEDHINILFSGDFFRKGGAHVIDAFEKVQKEYDNVRLRICSDANFKIINNDLKQKYLHKIKNNKGIVFGAVDRDTLMNQILPETDIFVSPTYAESYGFSIEEAMAYGIPVISTKCFAIPEMIEHEKNGFLIDYSQFDFTKIIRGGKGYTIKNIPRKFHNYMSDQVYEYLVKLIQDAKLRRKMGLKGRNIAINKFSFEKRNKIMKEIYEESV